MNMASKGRKSRGVFEDIWMNTQTGVDELDPANSGDPEENWEEIEEENIILNPDIDSLDWRG